MDLKTRFSLQARLARRKEALTAREEIRDAAMSFVLSNGVGGDFLEFGVFRGDGIVQAYHTNSVLVELAGRGDPLFVSRAMLQRAEVQARIEAARAMRFFAFDSFEGFPGATEVYEEGFVIKGDLACSQEEFTKNLQANLVELDRVVAVKGFFEDTLNERTKQDFALKAAAVVYIDCDLYAPTRLALDFCTSLLVDGTVIVFDDWLLFKGHPDRGEQGAFNEWREKNPQIRLSEFMRRGPAAFIVHG